MRSEDGTLGIGELARRTGASVRSIRYYELQGLLPAMRTAAGHRRFSGDAVETVRRIRMLLEGGLPLAIVAKIMPCFTGRGSALDPCVGAYLREHLELVQERIDALDRQRGTVERLRELVGA